MLAIHAVALPHLSASSTRWTSDCTSQSSSSPSLKHAAAAKLTTDATSVTGTGSAPGVFVFSELPLALNDILASITSPSSLSPRPQFTSSNLIMLPPSLFPHTGPPYSDLPRALEMPTIRELEDLIIHAIHLAVLCGKLDQKHAQPEVEFITAATSRRRGATARVRALAQHEQKLEAVLRRLPRLPQHPRAPKYRPSVKIPLWLSVDVCPEELTRLPLGRYPHRHHPRPHNHRLRAQACRAHPAAPTPPSTPQRDAPPPAPHKH
ncbi:hypothetical protein C8J57DRAFT_1635470 [Mycena rebaudengoi]|nr:hypothetical protein C8J57DRAFT_1635470 [Mycena rebaudengoi]